MNFIICDDNIIILRHIEEVIDVVMFQNKISYKKHPFNDYNGCFFDIMKSNIPNKIYILDIEVPTHSGIDVARMIRKNDYNSEIIFLSSYEKKYGYDILKSTIRYYTFISKMDDYKKLLADAINGIINVFLKRNIIKITDNGIDYVIEENDIVYILANKKTEIVCENNAFIVNIPLIKLKKQLSNNFVQTHRACIINYTKVKYIDYANSIIEFKNGIRLNYLSRRHKRQLKTYKTTQNEPN